MDDRSSARLDKFVRVLNFGRANAADVAATDAPQHLTKLEAIIGKLNTAKAGQKGGSAEAKDVLIDALRIDVQNITRTAGVIAQDHPGFEKDFRPPAAPNPAAIVTAADAIILKLVPKDTDTDDVTDAKDALRAKFTAKGLPADFATNLATDRAAIDTAKTAEDGADSEGVKNTKLVGTLVGDGMKECNYLDAIFHNVYTRVPEKTRAWMSESHLERAPQRKKPAPTPPQ
jgi:hypothetical protein